VDINAINPDIRAQLVAQNERLSNKKSTNPKEAKVRSLTAFRRVFAIAASLLLLISIAFFSYANLNFSQAALSAANYIEADLPGTLGVSDDQTALFQEGLNAYWTEKNYPKAAIAFSQITPESAEYVEAQYFLGHIAFKQKDFATAIQKYQLVLSNNQLAPYINRDKLTWSLLLARYANGENIQKDLATIKNNPTHPLNAAATQFLGQMNSFWTKFVF
jgi:tetratricopeptide (TPR) repeat protein